MIKPRIAVGIVLCSTTLMAGGCEDSAAQQRDAVQKTISQISRELSVAMSGANGADEGISEQKLNAVLSKLNAVSGGEAGQQAAKAMLAASAQQQLASIHLSKAQAIQASHADLRAMLNAKVDAVTMLGGLAASRGAYDIKPQINELGQQVESAQQHVEQLQGKIAELDGPISERTTQNQANQQEVDRLRLEVGELVSKARDLGASSGLSTFNQATDLRRQADKIEFDISNREIELDYDLTPDHQMASTQLEQLQGIIATLGETRDGLQSMSLAAAADAETSKKAVAALMDEINAALGTLASETDGSLKAEYDEAISMLEKAGTQADGAGRQLKGEDAQAARMMAARIRETLGRAHASQARAWGDHKNLLQRLVDSGAEGAAAFKSQLSAAETAQSEAVTKATEAFTAAQEAVQQVQSKSDPQAVVAFQQNLEAALASLQGKAPPTTIDEPLNASLSTPETDIPETQTPESDVEAQFKNADEFRDHLLNLPRSLEGFDSMLAFTSAKTAIGQRMSNASRRMLEALQVIEDAAKDRFDGDVRGDMTLLVPLGIGSLEKATIHQDGPTQRTYEVVWLGRDSFQIIHRVIDGEWKIDLDSLNPGTVDLANDMEKFGASMKKHAGTIAARIRSGELTDSKAAGAALGQLIAQDTMGNLGE